MNRLDSVLFFDGDWFQVVISFRYHGSLDTIGGCVGKQPWQTCDTCGATITSSFPSKEECTMPHISWCLFYHCERWPFSAEDAQQPSVLERRFPRGLAWVWWEHWVSNVKVRCPMLGADSSSLADVIAPHRLWWLGQLLPMLALSAHAGKGWKKLRDRQAMNWRRITKKLVSALVPACASRSPDWRS